MQHIDAPGGQIRNDSFFACFLVFEPATAKVKLHRDFLSLNQIVDQANFIAGQLKFGRVGKHRIIRQVDVEFADGEIIRTQNLRFTCAQEFAGYFKSYCHWIIDKN